VAALRRWRPRRRRPQLRAGARDRRGDFDSDYNFAYQLIGGVAYVLPSGWTLNGEARFFGINDQELENSEFGFKTTYHTFDLLFGATYRF
jgi:opacity protein-like surface antigen